MPLSASMWCVPIQIGPDGDNAVRVNRVVAVVIVVADVIEMGRLCHAFDLIPLELEWTEGLNLIPGRVEQLKTLGCNLAQPHVGWNDLIQKSSHPAFAGIADGIDFYFVHSFAFTPAESNHVIGVTDYDISITAVVSHDNILGCQFHPEKSSKAGQLFLQNWLKTC